MKSYGQIAFEAYNESKGGKTYDGKPIPPWGEVGDEVRKAWDAAADAVIDEYHNSSIRVTHRKVSGSRKTTYHLTAKTPAEALDLVNKLEW